VHVIFVCVAPVTEHGVLPIVTILFAWVDWSNLVPEMSNDVETAAVIDSKMITQ